MKRCIVAVMALGVMLGALPAMASEEWNNSTERIPEETEAEYRAETEYVTEAYDYSWAPDTVKEYAEAYGNIMIVDLTNQHVYCCVDGVIIADSDCVSGDLYNSPTPTGLYNVWYKNADFYMLDVYYSAYAVFFNDGIAIHDADAWRCEYGGTIYQGDGSHGCINTPRWFAEIVYNNSWIGTPVYVF